MSKSVWFFEPETPVWVFFKKKKDNNFVCKITPCPQNSSFFCQKSSVFFLIKAINCGDEDATKLREQLEKRKY